MKKLLLIASLFIAGIAGAQHEFHSADQGTPGTPALYTNDVIMRSDTIDQRRVRISVAFNGWLYAAFRTESVAQGKGGITILMSKDNGMNWSLIDSYFPTNTRYPAHDIVVCGTDTNALTVYMAGVNNNVATGTYVLFVDRYDGRTGAFSGSNYNKNNGQRKIYDVALASDYRNPAVGASPYSVGMLYSTYSSSTDSILFHCSTDGGNTWGQLTTVARTGYYFRNVSLAYGKSSSASNGRYFAAWERMASSTARVGNIYSGHCVSTVDGSWNTPVNLDSTSNTMIGVCSNPQIAVQFNNTDNDSGSCTAAVVVQRDYSANGTDYDLLGFYNKRSHYTDFWFRFDVVNTSENDLQPDITYDPGNDNFMLVYYDSTNSKLPYVINNYNFAAPSSWTTISAQYNDATNNLKAAWPRVEINPVVVQTAHAWIAEGANNKGVAMFDAEYNVTSVQQNQNVSHGGMQLNDAYPNPANNSMTISYTLSNSSDVSISIYNAIGELVDVRNIAKQQAGAYSENFDVSKWTAGVYFYRLSSGKEVQTRRIVIAH